MRKKSKSHASKTLRIVDFVSVEMTKDETHRSIARTNEAREMILELIASAKRVGRPAKAGEESADAA